MTQEALKLALEALKWCHGGEPCGTAEAIAVVEKALAQPEQFCDANCVWTDHHPDCRLTQTQEPVAHWSDCAVHSEPAYPKGECDCGGFNPTAWLVEDADGSHLYWTYKEPIGSEKWTPLFSTPPQEQQSCDKRTWVGIEGEEIRNLWEEAVKPDRSTMTMVTSFAKNIEAKLKERNT